MAEFDPVPPPLDLPAVPAILSPLVPLNPPMVGTASPFFPVDGENRDLVLDSIRVWIRTVLLAWTQAWETQLTEWEGDVATQLDTWLTEAAAYITEHAIAGLSFRTTDTPIAGAGTTNVTLVVDTDLRPITVGDLVLGSDVTGNYGVVTALIDATHATVTFVGSLRGPQGLPGLSFRTTATDIAGGGGTTDVVLAITPNRPLAITDLVVDQSADSNWGVISVVIDATHATVVQVGSFRGATGATGPAGADGTDGVVSSIVAGTNITVDSTDPANPIVSSSSGGAIQYFTVLSTMNAAAAGASEGDLAVLANDGTRLMTSVWTLTGGVWANPVIVFKTKNPGDWQAWVAGLDLMTNTSLSLLGASSTENVNGSHPRWDPVDSQWLQDKDVNRYLALGSNITPSGACVIETDNTVDITSATRAELWQFVPKDDHDAVGYEVHIWGVMADNGEVDYTMSDTTLGPNENASDYAGFGHTTQFDSSGVTENDPFHFSIGTNAYWPVTFDTSDASPAPTYVDIILRIYHRTSTADSDFQAIIAYLESVHYNAPAHPMNTMFNKTGTFYFYNFDGGFYDGGFLQFSEAFTGKMTVRSL